LSENVRFLKGDSEEDEEEKGSSDMKRVFQFLWAAPVAQG
jgi:hypothetical protein